MQQFRNAVESRDFDGLGALFTDDVVFRSPVVHAPYQGRDQVMVLLARSLRYSRTSGTSAR